MMENGISTSTIRSWHSVRTSRETHFRFCLRLKITLEESTYPSRRPQCPSLSHHFLLPFDVAFLAQITLKWLQEGLNQTLASRAELAHWG